MSFIIQQTLEYQDFREEISTLSQALDLLRENRVDEAKRLLVIRHDALLGAQRPIVKQYDPVHA